MRKKVLAALALSVLGTGAALANCEHAWISWNQCESCHGKGAIRRGTSGWLFRCSPCVNSYCNNGIYRETGIGEYEDRVKQTAREIVDEFGPLVLNMREGDARKIALEMANKNPLAAAFFMDIYMVSNRKGVSLPEEGVLGSGDEIITSEHDFENAKKFIENYGNEKIYDKQACLSGGSIKFRYDYNIKRLADGSAYFRIRVSEVNEKEEEVRILKPFIHVKLSAAEDGEGAYWKPIGWEMD